MDDLELQPVRVVEEDCVVAGHVRVFLRLALQVRLGGAQPLGPLVHRGARRHLEGEVVQADRVPVGSAAVDERADWLRSAEAQIESDPQEYTYMPGYYAVFFYDPDGLKLEILHVPALAA